MTDPLPIPSSARRRRLKPLLGAVSYVRRGRSRCFVCGIVENDPDYRHHMVYEDDNAIAFLARAPQFWGHTLVAPRQHLEHLTLDLDERSYLELQRVVYVVGRAVARAVPCERIYVLSLGSQQLNRHIHWHIAPLPPGVPLLKQQLRAFSEVITGVLKCSHEDLVQLARRIGEEIALEIEIRD